MGGYGITPSSAQPSFVPKPHVVMKQGMSNRQHINQRPPKSAFCNPSAAQITTGCIWGTLALRDISSGGAPFRIKLRTQIQLKLQYNL
jgi:hypothetical protein